MLGLRLGDLRLGEWRVLITEGKGGHERLVPLSPTFFATVGRYMDHERPVETTTDSLFVSLKGAQSGSAALGAGARPDHQRRPQRAGLSHGTCHELRHTCFTRLREAGMAIEAIQAQAGHRSITSTRVYLAPRPALAGRRVPPGHRSHRGRRHSSGWPNERAGCTTTGLSPARPGGGTPEVTWAEIDARAPLMVATMASYLDQLEVSARPGTVADAELTLRFFAHRVTTADPECVTVARHRTAPHRGLQALARRPVRARAAKGLSTMTIRHRLGTVRTFFERIMEWEYDDAPARLLIYSSDFPALDEPLPKFLDDPTASKFMAALALDPNLRRRLMVELLARTGMRVGELAGLEDDAMVRYDGVDRLRIPVGKLHNDRYVPLLPMLVDLIVDYKALRGRHARAICSSATTARPFDRRTVHRYVASVAKRAGVGPRPSAPAAPHARHPVHQPGHEPRSDRRLARAPFHGHDAHLRPHLRPHRRRGSTSR